MNLDVTAGLSLHLFTAELFDPATPRAVLQVFHGVPGRQEDHWSRCTEGNYYQVCSHVGLDV